jgi:hypothetical protein
MRLPPTLSKARRVAPWQSRWRFSFLERQKKWKGRLDCHGPAALAFDEIEGERIGFALALCLADFSSTLDCTLKQAFLLTEVDFLRRIAPL